VCDRQTKRQTGRHAAYTCVVLVTKIWKYLWWKN